MSKLQELINKLCPNGVEFKPLGELGTFENIGVDKKSNPNEAIFIDTQHFNYLFVKKYKTSNLHNGYELNKIFPNENIIHCL